MNTTEKAPYRPINLPIVMPRQRKNYYDSAVRRSWGLPEPEGNDKQSIEMINSSIEPEGGYIQKHMGNSEQKTPAQVSKSPYDPCVGSKYGF